MHAGQVLRELAKKIEDTMMKHKCVNLKNKYLKANIFLRCSSTYADVLFKMKSFQNFTIYFKFFLALYIQVSALVIAQ